MGLPTHENPYHGFASINPDWLTRLKTGRTRRPTRRIAWSLGILLQELLAHLVSGKWAARSFAKLGIRELTICPKAEVRGPRIKDLYHGELVLRPSELAINPLLFKLADRHLSYPKRLIGA